MNTQTQIQKTALITGGSRGLGRNTAESLARKGVDSVITYHSRADEARTVVAAIETQGRKAVALQLDTGDVGTFDRFAETLRAYPARHLGARPLRLPRQQRRYLAPQQHRETTEAELDALYNVHFKGVFFLTQKLLPLINDGGRIVNLSSGLTRIIMPGSAPYGSMKGAIEVLTKYMAKELGPRRIAVNVVAPGAIATDFSGGMVRDNPDLNKRVADMTALGRAGLPDDIGPMIASLLSEDNRWVNAQRIEVSGGMNI